MMTLIAKCRIKLDEKLGYIINIPAFDITKQAESVTLSQVQIEARELFDRALTGLFQNKYTNAAVDIKKESFSFEFVAEVLKDKTLDLFPVQEQKSVLGVVADQVNAGALDADGVTVTMSRHRNGEE